MKSQNFLSIIRLFKNKMEMIFLLEISQWFADEEENLGNKNFRFESNLGMKRI